MSNSRSVWIPLVLLLALVVGIGYNIIQSFRAGEPALVVYSGRSEPLVAALFERFEAETGYTLSVRYGDSAELAATLLEEGKNTPADLFFAQDAGALGVLAAEGRLQPLPADLLQRVDPRLRSPEGLWVGTSGRARVLAYNLDALSADELPESIWDLTDPLWAGRIGWAPTNGSFQAFVTALRILEGEERAAEWLRGVVANNPRTYHNNTAIVDALGRGEIHIGLTNHYYLHRFIAEQGSDFPVRNHYTQGDAGAMINVAGVGVLETFKNVEAAHALVAFLLSDEAQRYFAEEVHEYAALAETDLTPQAAGVAIPSLQEIATPDIDLTSLEDLEATLTLLQQTGVL